MSTPPWDPKTLMQPDLRRIVTGVDALEATMAVSDAYQGDLLDVGEADGMLVVRHPKCIAFMPYLKHRHTQDCNRA